MITDIEFGWLAGLLEGEGYFGLRSEASTPQVKLEMTDEDVVLRALILIQRITGKQHNLTYVKRKDKKAHYQPTFVIALYGKDAIKVMKKVVKLMGWRRRQKIWQTLNGFRAPVEKLDVKAVVALVTSNMKKVG